MKGIRGISQLSTRLYAAQAARKVEFTAAEHVKFQPQDVQRHFHVAARTSQSLAQPLAGIKLSPGSAHSLQDIHVTRLPSGLVIASLENYSPASKIGVFVRSGCRYETPENQGVTHVLRLASSLTTKGASAFKICRGVEAVGGSLSVTSSRENMVYTVDCLRDDFDTVMEYLINVTTAPEFRPWEVSDLTPRVKRDNAQAKQSSQIDLLEALHEAAYKNALSNSLYCPNHMVGNITSEHLHQFVQNNFTSARMALVGLGVDHEVADSSWRAVPQHPQWDGHNGGCGSVPWRARCVCPASAPWCTRRCVLQHILGAGLHVKRGSCASSKLVQGVTKATADPFDVSAFNASYSDSGLFGVYTISQSAAASGVIRLLLLRRKTGPAEGRGPDVSGDLRGSPGGHGLSALAEGCYSSTDEVSTNIDNVSLTDVANAAKKFVTGKKTMASSGNLVNTPFVDEV
ncbi:hypothetical protein KUCAC02_027026 [Chaenocephalus aceratus]|uniref:Uncharacterized protein n=1 Tax=Chaenocephalus aceratus TaxID=36190 RepID=A0ACB9W362_CHAAC|nr:hypothetical protein KUCAC02_027026 [Chaenocephalus aceratus]